MPTPLKKPVLLYDGDCAFCRAWINYWRTRTQNKIIYAPYQKHLNKFPQITLQDCQQGVQLITLNGAFGEGAEFWDYCSY